MTLRNGQRVRCVSREEDFARQPRSVVSRDLWSLLYGCEGVVEGRDIVSDGDVYVRFFGVPGYSAGGGIGQFIERHHLGPVEPACEGYL